MNGRYRSKEGIFYPFDTEPSDVDDKLHLHVDFDAILKEGYKIIVLNQQPGIGKTYTVMNYIMEKCRKDDNFTFFYFTDRHKTIYEHRERLRKDGDKVDKKIVETFGHWKGFGKHCEGHPESEKVDKLLEFNISIDTIKNLCEVDNCYKEYKAQFQNTKRVFAPFQYLSNEDFIKNPPKIVFLDERISQIETYSYDSEELDKSLTLIKAPGDYATRALLGRKEDKIFLQQKEVLDNIEKLYKKKVIGAITKGRKHLDKYKKLNPHKLQQYLFWSEIYDYEINSYSIPFYYKAFDIITTNNVPIVILDATFNKNLFSYFLESYNGEMRKRFPDSFNGFKNLKVKMLTSNNSNNKSIIYRMHPKGAWPKLSFTEKKDTSWPWLLEDLHRLRKIFGDANIGIITYKELSWLFESMNFDVEYFGNLRGTNLLENKRVLVIVGTWVPLPPSWTDKEKRDSNRKSNKKKKKKSKRKKDYIDKLVENYFLIRIDKKDLQKAKIGAPIPVEYGIPKLYESKKWNPRLKISIDSKLKEVEDMLKYTVAPDSEKVANYPICAINTIWFDEIYQAFHRNRGLRYPRIIFSYAWFPEKKMLIKTDNAHFPESMISYKLRDEFPDTIKVVEKSSKEMISKTVKDDIFDYYRKQEKGGIMQELMKKIELDDNVKDIADAFHIYKRGDIRSWDTKPITKLKRAYRELKDITTHREK